MQVLDRPDRVAVRSLVRACCAAAIGAFDRTPAGQVVRREWSDDRGAEWLTRAASLITDMASAPARASGKVIHAAFMSVSVTPGMTVFTVMPRGPNSGASARVRVSMAPFDAALAG